MAIQKNMMNQHRNSKIAIIVVFIAGILVLHCVRIHERVFSHAVYRMLFYLPLVLGSFWFGLRGAVYVSATVIIFYLPFGFDRWRGFLMTLISSLKGSANSPEEDVTGISEINTHFLLQVESERSFRARALILAMGISRKRLGLKGEKRFLGRGINYCVDCDAGFYKGETGNQCPRCVRCRRYLRSTVAGGQSDW